jgi:phage protein U
MSEGELAERLPIKRGYGFVLGAKCLRHVGNERGSLLGGGIPREQTFILALTGYRDDIQNV